jgi:hypothetical protein
MSDFDPGFIPPDAPEEETTFSTPGAGDPPAPGLQTPRIAQQNIAYIVQPEFWNGEISSMQTVTENLGTGSITRSQTRVTTCVCGRPISSPQQYGGRCSHPKCQVQGPPGQGNVGKPICSLCAQHGNCVISGCGKLCCRKHRRQVGKDRYICRSHNFFVAVAYHLAEGT